MSMNYSTFTFNNNESVILLPGNRFSKNELLSRLHEMGANIDNYQGKSSLNYLYDSYLSDNRNKLKIYHILKKDTENQKSRLGLSQKQSIMASNANTMLNNSKNKILNVSCEVNPFSEHQNMNNVNREERTQNIVISKNKSQNKKNQNYNYGYNDNQIGNNYNNNNNNYQDSRTFQNSNNINNSKYSQYSQQSNNQNQNNYQQKYDNSMNSLKNSSNNRYNMNNNTNNDMTYTHPYQEEINNNTQINRNNQRYYQENKNDNQKIFTNIRTPNPNYQDYRNSLLISENSNKNSSNNNINSNINFSFNDNNSYNYNNEYSNQMYPNQNQNNNSQRMVIEEQKQSMFPDDENKNQNINYQPNSREPDEESTFSIFSTLKDFKNSDLYKNRKKICFYLLISLLVFLIVIGALYCVSNYWDSISNFFTAILSPRRVIEGIFGFISSVLFGSVRYFYITIPLIAIIILMVIYGRKYLFKRRCRVIMNNILEYLKNNENRENNIIYEDEIYRRFVKDSGISYEYFKNRIIPQMDKLRRDYPLKTYSTTNGKNIRYWALQ